MLVVVVMMPLPPVSIGVPSFASAWSGACFTLETIELALSHIIGSIR
jgi:hypothetical protein